MTEKHIAYYLGSKVMAALINLGALALFVRIGGTETYAAYLIMFAWAYILYGVTVQWLKFSFFACYKDDSSSDLVSTYLGVLGLGLIAIFVLLFLGYVLGFETAQFGIGLVALILGLSLYEALLELARIRLHSRVVAAGILIRAVLMLTLGVLSLVVYGTALGLALAVGAAHLGASIPLLIDGRDKVEPRFSADAARALWQYGRPMVPAFVLGTTGWQLDRLLLARFAPLSTVGVYGVATDFVRQTMVVISEAIAGAYMSVARAQLAENQIEKATNAMGEAFLAYTALTTFVIAFIMRFDQLVFGVLFGADVATAIEPVLFAILVANAMAIYRSYYFEQASHLTESSNVFLLTAVVGFAVLVVSSLLLIPSYGMLGAALGVLLGHVAGCLVYAIAWRKRFIMKLPYLRSAIIAGVAGGTYVLTGWIMQIGSGGVLATIASVALFAATSIGVARAFNILSLNDLAAGALVMMRRKLAQRRSPEAN